MRKHNAFCYKKHIHIRGLLILRGHELRGGMEIWKYCNRRKGMRGDNNIRMRGNNFFKDCVIYIFFLFR